MSFKIGDRVKIALGDMRNKLYTSATGDQAYLDGIEDDGTIFHIHNFHTDYPDWCAFAPEGRYYPVPLLLSADTTLQKLHKLVKGLR